MANSNIFLILIILFIQIFKTNPQTSNINEKSIQQVSENNKNKIISIYTNLSQSNNNMIALSATKTTILLKITYGNQEHSYNCQFKLESQVEQRETIINQFKVHNLNPSLDQELFMQDNESIFNENTQEGKVFISSNGIIQDNIPEDQTYLFYQQNIQRSLTIRSCTQLIQLIQAEDSININNQLNLGIQNNSNEPIPASFKDDFNPLVKFSENNKYITLEDTYHIDVTNTSCLFEIGSFNHCDISNIDFELQNTRLPFIFMYNSDQFENSIPNQSNNRTIYDNFFSMVSNYDGITNTLSYDDLKIALEEQCWSKETVSEQNTCWTNRAISNQIMQLIRKDTFQKREQKINDYFLNYTRIQLKSSLPYFKNDRLISFQNNFIKLQGDNHNLTSEQYILKEDYEIYSNHNFNKKQFEKSTFNQENEMNFNSNFTQMKQNNQTNGNINQTFKNTFQKNDLYNIEYDDYNVIQVNSNENLFKFNFEQLKFNTIDNSYEDESGYDIQNIKFNIRIDNNQDNLKTNDDLNDCQIKSIMKNHYRNQSNEKCDILGDILKIIPLEVNLSSQERPKISCNQDSDCDNRCETAYHEKYDYVLLNDNGVQAQDLNNDNSNKINFIEYESKFCSQDYCNVNTDCMSKLCEISKHDYEETVFTDNGLIDQITQSHYLTKKCTTNETPINRNLTDDSDCIQDIECSSRKCINNKCTSDRFDCFKIKDSIQNITNENIIYILKSDPNQSDSELQNIQQVNILDLSDNNYKPITGQLLLEQFLNINDKQIENQFKIEDQAGEIIQNVEYRKKFKIINIFSKQLKENHLIKSKSNIKHVPCVSLINNYEQFDNNLFKMIIKQQDCNNSVKHLYNQNVILNQAEISCHNLTIKLPQYSHIKTCTFENVANLNTQIDISDCISIDKTKQIPVDINLKEVSSNSINISITFDFEQLQSFVPNKKPIGMEQEQSICYGNVCYPQQKKEVDLMLNKSSTSDWLIAHNYYLKQQYYDQQFHMNYASNNDRDNIDAVDSLSQFSQADYDTTKDWQDTLQTANQYKLDLIKDIQYMKSKDQGRLWTFALNAISNLNQKDDLIIGGLNETDMNTLFQKQTLGIGMDSFLQKNQLDTMQSTQDANIQEKIKTTNQESDSQDCRLNYRTIWDKHEYLSSNFQKQVRTNKFCVFQRLQYPKKYVDMTQVESAEITPIQRKVLQFFGRQKYGLLDLSKPYVLRSEQAMSNFEDSKLQQNIQLLEQLDQSTFVSGSKISAHYTFDKGTDRFKIQAKDLINIQKATNKLLRDQIRLSTTDSGDTSNYVNMYDQFNVYHVINSSLLMNNATNPHLNQCDIKYQTELSSQSLNYINEKCNQTKELTDNSKTSMLFPKYQVNIKFKPRFQKDLSFLRETKINTNDLKEFSKLYETEVDALERFQSMKCTHMGCAIDEDENTISNIMGIREVNNGENISDKAIINKFIKFKRPLDTYLLKNQRSQLSQNYSNQSYEYSQDLDTEEIEIDGEKTQYKNISQIYEDKEQSYPFQNEDNIPKVNLKQVNSYLNIKSIDIEIDLKESLEWFQKCEPFQKNKSTFKYPNTDDLTLNTVITNDNHHMKQGTLEDSKVIYNDFQGYLLNPFFNSDRQKLGQEYQTTDSVQDQFNNNFEYELWNKFNDTQFKATRDYDMNAKTFWASSPFYTTLVSCSSDQCQNKYERDILNSTADVEANPDVKVDSKWFDFRENDVNLVMKKEDIIGCFKDQTVGQDGNLCKCQEGSEKDLFCCSK